MEVMYDITTPPCGHPDYVHMVVIVDHRIVGTQFIASANDVSDAMNRVPTIKIYMSVCNSGILCKFAAKTLQIRV